MGLEKRYQDIQKKVEEFSDFSEEELTLSRNLFHLESDRVVPKILKFGRLLLDSLYLLS
jgi:hypothetical protein